MTALQKEIKVKERQIQQNNKEIERIFDDLGKTPNLTQEQFQSHSNTPNLKSWMNWGIIAIVVIATILIVNFIFGLFKKTKKSMGIE